MSARLTRNVGPHATASAIAREIQNSASPRPASIAPGQMSRIAFAQVGDEFAEAGKRARARLVGEIIRFKRRMVFHPGNERIQFRPPDRVVEIGIQLAL